MGPSLTAGANTISPEPGPRDFLARWRRREVRMIEASPTLGRFANPPGEALLAAVVALAIAFRLASLFAVLPGNAPDEIGHMAITLALSQPEIMTLKDEHNFTNYPYAIYNPLAYVPSAILLHAGGWVDGSLNRLDVPLKIADRTAYVARAGMLAWAAVFLFFLVKVARLYLGRDAWLAVGFCGLLPQLTFVQTYVNLDAIGVAAFAMMVWALSVRSLPLVALSVALVANAKLNFICTLPLVFVSLVSWDFPNAREIARKVALLLVLPALTAAPWYVWNYYTNTREYGSYLGFGALMQLYGESSPGGRAAFTKGFTLTTIRSAFGQFGWMNLLLPIAFYRIWLRVFLSGAAVLFLCAFISRAGWKWRAWHLGLCLVFAANLALHYWASYANAYQPQGRYIFPAVLIALFYLALALQWFSANVSPILGQAMKYATLAFFVLTAALAIRASRPDPEFRRFNIDLRPQVRQDSAGAEIPGFSKGSYLRQTFVPEAGVLRCIELPVSVEKRGKVDKKLSMTLLDDRGEVLHSQVKSSAEFAKETSIIFPLHDLRVEPGRAYSLAIEGIDSWSEGGSVTFHRSEEDAYPGGALFVGPRGDPTGSDLAFRVY